MTRFLIALGLVGVCAVPAHAQMTCSATNVSAVAVGSSAAAAATMPTTAPTNATLWAAIYNRSNTTTTVTGTAGDVNTTGWVTSAPFDNTSTAGRSWYAYKVGATTGADVVTASFSGSISWQIVVGWCAHSSGSAQTFDVAAAGLDVAVATANYDSNTLSAAGAGGLLSFTFTSVNQVGLTADGAGETRISGVGATRTQVMFEPYGSAGTYGTEATLSNSSVGNIMVAGFLDPASTCTGGLALLGAGKCD